MSLIRNHYDMMKHISERKKKAYLFLQQENYIEKNKNLWKGWYCLVGTSCLYFSTMLVNQCGTVVAGSEAGYSLPY
jgi:hypothetical protein